MNSIMLSAFFLLPGGGVVWQPAMYFDSLTQCETHISQTIQKQVAPTFAWVRSCVQVSFKTESSCAEVK